MGVRGFSVLTVLIKFEIARIVWVTGTLNIMKVIQLKVILIIFFLAAYLLHYVEVHRL